MSSELVLLTGGTGNAGYSVLKHLAKAGYRVRLAVRNDAAFDWLSSLRPTAPFKSQFEKVIVPDMVPEGAYDQAVQGVDYVIHVASPVPHMRFHETDWEETLVQPAVAGAINMLEAAKNEPKIKRVVITSSSNTLAIPKPPEMGRESALTPIVRPPYSDPFTAYLASKTQSAAAVEQWMATQKPHFDLVNIKPTLILGRDDIITDVKLAKEGSNGMAFRCILGEKFTFPVGTGTVHVDDVGRTRVDALKLVPAGDYLICGDSRVGSKFDQTYDILKRRFPKECEEGIFTVNDVGLLPEANEQIYDSTKGQTAFGYEFKGYEEQLVSFAEHYLELFGRK